MDPTESIALDFLRHSGYRDIVYEPDGNVPPDFLIDNEIAVEVRRLNQHANVSGVMHGLEVTEIPLLDGMRSLLDDMGAPIAGCSWWVSFVFKRPVKKWSALRPAVREWLRSVRDGDPGAPLELAIANFAARVRPRQDESEKAFALASMGDHDSSGWLLHKLRRNVGICIDEKTRKTAERRHRYGAWWLILVDHIGYRLTPLERELMNRQPPLEHTWQRVILIDPLDPRRWLEL